MRKLSPQQQAIVHELTKDLPPFTITFTSPDDASFLTNAVFHYIAYGNSVVAESMAAHMGHMTKRHGPAEGVRLWMEEAKQHNCNFPKWFGPMMTHWFENIQRNIAKSKGGTNEPH